VHLGTVVIVASTISCKVLEVSNHYFLRQIWVFRGTTLVLLSHTFTTSVTGSLAWVSMLLRRPKEDGVIGVRLEGGQLVFLLV
jgi:hypothetical protein